MGQPGMGAPNATGQPWGPWGPFGPWGPYMSYPSSATPSAPTAQPTERGKRSMFGMSMFSPYAGLYQQMVFSKLNGVSSSVIMKKQFKFIASSLNDELQVAKADLDSQLDALHLVAIQTAMQSQQYGRDISPCTLQLQTATDDITLKINALDVEVEKTELGKNITRDIDFLKTQAKAYGKLMKACNPKFSPMFSQMDGIEDCATNAKASLDQLSEDGKTFISNDISTLQTETEKFITDTKNEVQQLIKQAGDDFDSCIRLAF